MPLFPYLLRVQQRTPNLHGLFLSSWLVPPLNAGNETKGKIMVLFSRKYSVTEGQQKVKTSQ
jgi:hypothetical protein